MRWTAGAALLALGLSATPARAEIPAAFSAWIGSGFGSWQRVGAREPDGAIVALLGMEGAWSLAPRRALVAACDFAAGPLITLDGSASAERLEHFALTLGPEFSVPWRSEATFFCRGSVGFGSVTYFSAHETGFAWSAAAGASGLRRLGPFRGTLTLHAEGTSAQRTRCSCVGFSMGIELYPLDRSRDGRSAGGSLVGQAPGERAVTSASRPLRGGSARPSMRAPRAHTGAAVIRRPSE